MTAPVLHLAVEFLANPAIPNPDPRAPEGAQKITQVVGNLRWLAGLALVVGFLAGLTTWAGGRWVDHHRAGRIGLIMMLCSFAGALLYGIGYQLITGFAGTG